MAQVTIDADADSNGVRSDIVGTWAAARTDDPAKETTTFLTQVSTDFQCGRAFFFFDMSGVSTGSTITSATLRFAQVANVTDTNSGSVHVVEHVATDPIGTDDFNSYKSLNSDVSFGNVDLTNLNTGSTTDVTINSTGITYLESVIQGTAKIGIRSSEDFDNSSPSGLSQYTAAPTDFDLIVNFTTLIAKVMIF